MSSNYLFNEVTGQSDYERQSWRDSYNGGRAAGDITGNVNRELDAQREANNGRTESGSSTQYAAFEVAPIRQGNAAAAVGAGAPKSGGPGNQVVTQGPVTPGRPAGGSGPGSRLVIDAPDMSVLMPKDGPLKRIGIGSPQESLGGISDIGWVRTQTGWQSVPSDDMKQRMEDDIFQEAAWQWRNKIMPDIMLAPQPYPEFIQNREALEYSFVGSEWRTKPGYVAIGGGF